MLHILLLILQLIALIGRHKVKPLNHAERKWLDEKIFKIAETITPITLMQS